MKYLFLILFLSLNIFAQSNKNNEKVIMLKILPKNIQIDESIDAIFRSGVEEVLTENKYSLVSEEVQNETLKEQAEQRKKECFDESCLVETGKMLAARGLFVIDIIKLKENYMFKLKYINLETSEVLQTKSLFYSNQLDDAKSLFEFAKELTRFGIEKNNHINSIKSITEINTINENNINNEEELKKEDDNMIIIPQGKFIFGKYKE